MRRALMVLVVGLMVVVGRTALLTRLFFAERAAAARLVSSSTEGQDHIRHGHATQGKSRRLAFVPFEADDDCDDDGDDDCLCASDALPCAFDLTWVPEAVIVSRAAAACVPREQVSFSRLATYGARAPPSLRVS
jgi:hypothetical protein